MIRLFDSISNNIVKLLKINLNVGEGEKCLILNDLPNSEELKIKTENELKTMFERTLLAVKFFKICRKQFTSETNLLTFTSRGISGAEPPRKVAEAMLKHNVIIILTTHSLSHTDARRSASEKGARVASMPGFTKNMLKPGGPMDVDYNIIACETKKLASKGASVNKIKISSPEGTELTLEKGSRTFIPDYGLYTEPGRWGNLPAGEVYCAPLEGSANGILYVKKGWYPNLREDMKITVVNGFVKDIIGGGEIGKYFKNLLGIGKRDCEKKFTARRCIAEFGIGTNPQAKNPGNILEAEKIKGTVHIALGDNSHFGGFNKADIHIDFVYPNITVWFDDQKIIENGSWIF
ncbi:MAG: hypothetical protein QW327_02915 [Candidatus Odinarchaeota archaeon]